jgi:hypothetical protein
VADGSAVWGEAGVRIVLESRVDLQCIPDRGWRGVLRVTGGVAGGVTGGVTGGATGGVIALLSLCAVGELTGEVPAYI